MENKEKQDQNASDNTSQNAGQLIDAFKMLAQPQRSQLSQSIADAFQVMASPALMDSIQNMTKMIVDVIQFDWNGIAEAIRQTAINLNSIIEKIQFSEISEELKNRLLQSHRQWGEYGWTIIPMKDKLFDRPPKCRKDANKTALKECSNATMKKLFAMCSDMKYCKKSDLAEAVFDFENKQYKSCALILFALIDAKLIRFQKGSKHRKVGLKAVQIAKQRADEGVEEHMLMTMLFYTNLFACLEKVFENGKDFRKQPEVINRNFLDHGMLTRKVTRMDCVQLFLLYYNVLDLLELNYQ